MYYPRILIENQFGFSKKTLNKHRTPQPKRRSLTPYSHSLANQIGVGPKGPPASQPHTGIWKLLYPSWTRDLNTCATSLTNVITSNTRTHAYMPVSQQCDWWFPLYSCPYMHAPVQHPCHTIIFTGTRIHSHTSVHACIHAPIPRLPSLGT